MSMSVPAWLVLRGADAALTPVQQPRSRIVLLHGWLQEHGAWLRTALALRDLYRHDVLLIDFYGHGASPALSAELMTPVVLVRMVSERIAALGWDRGAPIVLAGASLGAAVAMRYARDHPGRVERLTLVAPAGLSEPWWHPTRYAGGLVGALLAAAPACLTEGWPLNGKLHLIATTPCYGLAEEEVSALASSLGSRLVVIAAGLDVVHSPHRDFWRALAAEHCTQFSVVERSSHWWVCLHLFELGLHLQEPLWHDPGLLPVSEPTAPPPPTSRL